MPARLELEFDLGRATAPRDEGSACRGPMRLLVMGDFSGRPATERPPLASRPTQRVDLDNLDDVMRRLAPQLPLPSGELRFEEIEDFHPDALYSRFGLFAALRQARAKPPAAAGDLFGSLLGKPAVAAAQAAAAPATGIDAFIHSIVAPHRVIVKCCGWGS